jgi:DNA-binding beta-propeller fold protein YncE
MTPNRSVLLAVNLPDNRLEVFNLTTPAPTLIRSIPVGLDPVSVRARNNLEAWVVNHVSDSISVVDLLAGQVIATLQTDDEPTDVVFAGNPVRAYVSCSMTNTVLVFNPANRAAPPQRITIQGEEPRELAVSPAGDKVYVAIFESGNRTTIIGNGGTTQGDFPPNAIEFPNGPYGGQNPAPNSGLGFDPPIDAGLPPPPGVAQIVRQNAAGQWLDDNGGNWTNLVSGNVSLLTGRRAGWSMSDHDVAVIDTASLTVTYLDRLMNLCMALAVNPASGFVSVVGTEATNEVRFEPNVKGTFVRSMLALVNPAAPGTPGLVDMNGHLTYATPTVPQADRDRSLADPRGIAWNAAGTRAYVTGMGSNNVVVLGANGARAGLAPTIEVGEGPTGIVLDEPRQRLYVLNKFDASISLVDTTTELETARLTFFDPTPAAIQAGRKHLYDAHATSGLGVTSCAACHVDARIDRLAWDLGDPTGEMKGLEGLNLGAGIPEISNGFVDFHPMKGPMLTQTLQDIVGKEPFHWRGDRLGLEEFNPAFEGLLGDDEQLSPAEMQEFEDFLATIAFPPNPFRTLENALAEDVPLPGHFTTGRFAPAGQPLPNGDAANGRVLYAAPGINCIRCHTLPTGMGPNATWNGTEFVPLADGPNGEAQFVVHPPSFAIEQNIKIPSLRNLPERVGFDGTQLASLAGFGFRHDGAIDSVARFVSRQLFAVTSDQDVADLVAFLLSLSGGIEAEGPIDELDQPPGSDSLSTHAAVGRQVTFDGSANPAGMALLTALLAEAEQGDIGVVARLRIAGLDRGLYYRGGGRFQSDRGAERFQVAVVLAGTSPTTPLTITAVPPGSERRIGVNRDGDTAFDRDELDLGFDPADPGSRPKARRR